MLKPLGPNADPRLRLFAALPRVFLLHKKRLYRADDNGNPLRTAPGRTGTRKYGIIGSRNRKYYLRLLPSLGFHREPKLNIGYSVRRLLTGFCRAARIVLMPIVSRASATAVKATKSKNIQTRSCMR